MKQLSIVLAVSIFVTLSGCGRVSIDTSRGRENVGSAGIVDGASYGTTTSTSSTNTTTDTGSDTDAGAGGQAPQPRLVVSLDGNVPAEIEGCQKAVVLLPLKYAVSGGAISTNVEQMGIIPPLAGPHVVGSAKTPYFYNARLVRRESGASLMGPVDPKDAPGPQFYLHDVFTLENGVHHLALVVDLACEEDAPGEFFGLTYQAGREPVFMGALTDAADGSTIDPSLTAPDKTISSNQFTIVAPPLSAEAKASPKGQYWYDGMPDPDIITPPPTPFNDSQKWWMAEYLVSNTSNGVPLKIVGGVIRQNDPNGDTADCDEVGLEYAGNMLASATKGSNSRWVLTEIPGQPAFAAIDPGLGHLVKAVCKVAVPLSSAAAGGAWHGVPRSGHTPQFVLEELTLRSAIDGRTLTLKPEIVGPRMLVRKGKPLINWELQDGLLHEGLNTIAKIGIDSLGVESVGFRQTYFEFHASPGVTFDTIGINPFIVNGVEVEKNDTAYVYSDAANGIATYFKMSTDAPVLLTIELRINVHGVVSGSNIHTTFMHSQDEDATNYRLVGSGPPGVLLTLPEFGLGLPKTSSFIWTDFAEGAQHVPTDPSSLDYYSGFLVPGLAGESIVSAP